MKKTFLLLAVAAMAVTGCRSDDNGMNPNGQDQPENGSMNNNSQPSSGNMNNGANNGMNNNQ